jgi:hypothetical protein
LADALGANKSVIGWDGSVALYENGFINGRGQCRRYRATNNRTVLDEADIPKGRSGASAVGAKVTLGNLITTAEYETHELSKKVFELRKNTVIVLNGKRVRGDFGGVNYAVYEYKDLNGEIKYVARSGIRGGAHSEEVCEEFLRDLNIPNDNVLRIYTERSPCFPGARASDDIPNCRHRIATNFPKAEVSYTFPYDAPSTNKDVKKFMATYQKPPYQIPIE